MASAELGTVVHHLRRWTVDGGHPLSDRELLEQFVREQEQRAFTVLLERHGPMVLALCRRVLGDLHDAEDAFQAVFLVLARRAGQVRWQDSVANWLYGVALRIARKARMTRQQRRTFEQALVQRKQAAAEPSVAREDLQGVLDDELSRLPAQYRKPLVLCHLQEQTQGEAAKQLGCSEGTIRGRLYRGREMLRRRLAARGLSFTSALLVAALSRAGAKAAVSPVLTRSTVQIALNGTASPLVTTLAEGALQFMLIGKCKIVASLMAAVALLGVGGWYSHQAFAGKPQASSTLKTLLITLPESMPSAVRPGLDEDDKKEKGKKARVLHGQLKAVDSAKAQIVAKVEEDDQDIEATYDVPKDAKVTIAGKSAQSEELKKGMHCAITFAADDKTVAGIEAKWPSVRCKLKTIDPAKTTVSFALEGEDEVVFDVTLSVAAEAPILIGGLRSSLGDLKEGKKVTLDVTGDKKTVVRLEAERDADEVFASLKDVNTTTNTLTLTLKVNGPREEFHTDVRFDAIPDVPVRIKGKDGQLKDLTKGMRVWFKLAEDRRTVITLRADDPAPKNEEDDDD